MFRGVASWGGLCYPKPNDRAPKVQGLSKGPEPRARLDMMASDWELIARIVRGDRIAAEQFVEQL